MKLRYFGLFLFLIGFTVPFAISRIFPTFLYSTFLSTICFWAGFLIILRPVDSSEKISSYLKWARYAIVLHIILSLLCVGYFYLIFYYDFGKNIGFYLTKFLGFVTNPIRSTFDIIVAKPMVEQADGSVLVTTTYIRFLLTEFFNLSFYALSGMILNIIKNKKITNRLTCPGKL